MHVRNLRAGEEQRDVRNVFRLARHVTDSGSRDRDRFCRQHTIHDREIVNREIPDYVHVVLKQSEVNAHRVVVIDLTQLPGTDQLANLPHCICVNERVVHEKNQVSRRGFVDQFARLIRFCRQWFFDKHVFAGFQRRHRQIKMR